MTIRSTLASVALLASLATLAACGGEGRGHVAFVVSGTGAATAQYGLDAASPAEPSTTHEACRPERALKGATVTFSSILARNLDGVLTDVTIALPVAVDLFALDESRQATLPIGALPPGTYDQLVVVMTQVELTLLDGTKIAITPPGGGWTAIVAVAQPFTVAEGETTTVGLKFRKDLSFGCGSGKWEYHPRFDCDH